MTVKDDTILSNPQNSARTKRLGQYFTGIRLAKLLASLSEAVKASSIIDPMSGDGDMIEACLQVGAKAKTVAGMEIDPIAREKALRRFKHSSINSPQIVLGNAFSPDTLKKLPELMYDLVITNPPYVRYQNQAHSNDATMVLPDADAIRRGLLEIVDFLPALDDTDRHLFRSLIKQYSGLSDLAVPAWLLSAMLTQLNGTLAMVVPSAWLSRDYAKTIQYVLHRWFTINYVVEDDGASWFRNALVKTTLVVAKRVERRDSAFSWEDEGFTLAHLSGQATDDTSIVGRLFPDNPQPDLTFAKQLAQHAHQRTATKGPFVSLEWIPLRQTAGNLKRGSFHDKWIVGLEEPGQSFQLGFDKPVGADQAFLHPALCAWLGENAMAQFTCLSSLGINIGQGLRTGANQFFYVDALSEDGPNCVVAPAPLFGFSNLTVPAECLSPVLRRQSELPEGFALDVSAVNGRALVLRDRVLSEQCNSALRAGTRGDVWKSMPDDLARFVRVVASTNVGTHSEPKFIPNLSAVKTNVRNGKRGTLDHVLGFWYMLPLFSKRHRPDLFVARVNGSHPKTYLNTDNHVLIDANFSTFWLEKDSPFGAQALLALLNSTWCVTSMELMGTVMGGGALKLEATHLRRIPIPKLNAAQRSQLQKLGTQLAHSNSPDTLIDQIDRIVLSAIHSRRDSILDISSLQSLKREQLRKRSKRS